MLRRLILWPLCAVGLVLAALGLGAVPLPVSYPAAAEVAGPKLYRVHVLSNGFHAAIALPADALVFDSGMTVMEAVGLDPGNHPVDPSSVRHWLFGWGSQTAYTSLREVSDLTLGIATRALAFDATVMHVQPLGALDLGREGLYAIDVSQQQLDTLVASIARSFVSKAPMVDLTQGFGDRFFRGRGRFSPWMSCNTWVGARLREAGIGVGSWTPLPQTLEFGLSRVSAAQAR